MGRVRLLLDTTGGSLIVRGPQGSALLALEPTAEISSIPITRHIDAGRLAVTARSRKFMTALFVSTLSNIPITFSAGPVSTQVYWQVAMDCKLCQQRFPQNSSRLTIRTASFEIAIRHQERVQDKAISCRFVMSE